MAKSILDHPEHAATAVAGVGDHRSSLFADWLSVYCKDHPDDRVSEWTDRALSPNSIWPNCQWYIEPADRDCGSRRQGSP